MRNGVDYLKHLTRYGLDKKVLADYRSYGILFCSQRVKTGAIKTFEFLDIAGIDQAWIDTINDIENEGNYTIYHIINNSVGNEIELDCLYYDNDIEFDPQFHEFKSGIAKCIRYFPDKEGKLSFEDVKYKVIKGGVSIEFNSNM